MNLVRLLTDSESKHRERTALHLENGESLTYGEVTSRVAGLQRGLKQLGVGRGDRVVVMLPNGVEFVTSYFAVLSCGAVVVPLNTKLKPQELEYILGNVGANVVITFSAAADGLTSILDRVPTQQLLTIDGQHPSTQGVGFEACCSEGGELEGLDAISEQDHAVYLYTSGTTGKPKGVILSHGNFLANLSAVSAVFDLSEQDLFVAVLPLYHSFGHAICMLLPIMNGASLAPLPKFSPSQVLQQIQERRATVFAAVPTMYALLAQTESAESYDLSTLRYSFSGGAALPRQVMTDFESAFGVTIFEGYGHTEASPVVFVNPSREARKPGSVGLPIPDVEVMLIDDDGNEVTGPGTGELLVRGPSIMEGYFNLPDATADVLDDGWLKMRDLFRRDEEGYFFLIDRLVDLIIVGGANVYPREVEEVLYSCDKVGEAAVVGVADKIYGETVKAVVALKPGKESTTEELIAYCGERLAPYKVPKEVELMGELPKTSTGKISKKELR